MAISRTTFKVGHPVSDEVRAKVSAANRGRPMSENTRAALLAANTGRKQSEKNLAAIKKSRIGSHHTPETRAKMSAACTGKGKGIPKSEETKRKMSITQKAKSTRMSDRQKAILLAANIGRKQSAETIAKRVAKISGAGGGNWKGGITPANMKIRSSRNYANWRTLVFARDDYVCQKCGAHNGEGHTVVLRAHHMDGFADFPEKRLDIENGITFCDKCHREFHRRYGMKHNRQWQVDEYLSKKEED